MQVMFYWRREEEVFPLPFWGLPYVYRKGQINHQEKEGW